MSTIRLTFEEKIARLEINRAEKYNALTQSMWEQIIVACDEIETQVKPRVLIVSGAGGKAFSAGADIEELKGMIQLPETLKRNNQLVQLAQQKLESLSCATIAQIDGVCMGGGLGLALSCDFRLCSTNSRFGITPAKLGLLYSIEDTRRLVNIVGVAKAKEMLYLGTQISAETAKSWGLVSEIFASDLLTNEVNEMSKNIATVSGDSVKGIKKTIGFLTHSGAESEQHIRALFDQAFNGQDFLEGAQAFLQKRPAKF